MIDKGNSSLELLDDQPGVFIEDPDHYSKHDEDTKDSKHVKDSLDPTEILEETPKTPQIYPQHFPQTPPKTPPTRKTKTD